MNLLFLLKKCFGGEKKNLYQTNKQTRKKCFSSQKKTQKTHNEEKMLRNLSFVAPSKISTTTTATTTAFLLTSLRNLNIPAKGRCEYRLDYTHSNKRGPEALKDMKEAQEKKARDLFKEPKTKKEKLAHLLERPKYEYVADFQRNADDMMAIQSDPRKFCDDMSYHFTRVGKQMNGTGTWMNENSSCGTLLKIKGPH